MSQSTDDRNAFNSYVAQVAGDVHRRVMEQVMPWVRADAAERERLLSEALKHLKDENLITADEYENLRVLTGEMNHQGATRAAVLTNINTSRQAILDSGTPLYSALLNIAADSVDSTEVVAVAAADLAGGIFGGVVFGPIGAVAGAVGLSVFVAS